MSLSKNRTSAPIWDAGIPERMRTRELYPLHAPIIEKIAANTQDKNYTDSVEVERYGPQLSYTTYPVSNRNELRPHWEMDGDHYSHVSIVGPRTQNEDASLYIPAQRLFAIFDGWGGRTTSQQAVLFLKKTAEEQRLFRARNNHIRDKHDMLTAFHSMQELFHQLNRPGSIDPAYLYRSLEPRRARGATAIIATVGLNSVTVGSLGDSEAYVLDASTGRLAIPSYFEAYDAQTNALVKSTQNVQLDIERADRIAAATLPHGLVGLPKYTQPGNLTSFSHFEDDAPQCELENSVDPILFHPDPGRREYDIAKMVNDDVDPPLQQVNNTSRLWGSCDPRRSLGEIADEWDRTYGRYKPLTEPEIHTWRFAQGFASKWLMLCCDGLYNNNAFRGPKSVCAFLMDPFHFLAFELEKSGNQWVQLIIEQIQLPDNVQAPRLKAAYEAFLHFTETSMRCYAISPAISVQRPLLAAYFDHIYRIDALCPLSFGPDTDGADAIHQAAIYLSQWANFGKLGGLAGSPADLEPLDLIGALAYLCTMLYAYDNVSISLVKLF